MKLVKWFLKFFSAPTDKKAVTRGPKFLEGAQWVCPKCRTVLATARRDVYSGEPAAHSFRLNGVRDPRWHCGVDTMRNHGGRQQIFTPTGWVG